VEGREHEKRVRIRGNRKAIMGDEESEDNKE
jgi:hypothetical protein